MAARWGAAGALARSSRPACGGIDADPAASRAARSLSAALAPGAAGPSAGDPGPPGAPSGLGAAVAAAAAGCAAAATAAAAGADAAAPSPPGAPAPDPLPRLAGFLSRCGVAMPGLAVRPVGPPDAGSAGGGRGELGIVVTEEGQARHRGSWARRAALWLAPWAWGGERELARFPLAATLTLDTATADPWFGEAVSEIVGSGLAGERAALAFWLCLHGALGEASPLWPYLASLPDAAGSPLVWGDAELAELRGTPLHAAVGAYRADLSAQWKHLGPLAAEALRAARARAAAGGGPPADPSRVPDARTLAWAHAVVASRSLGLPTGPHGLPELALVPGLDFANHDPDSPFR